MPENTVALVTGASRGIGRAIATRLGAQGITVIGTATTDAGAEAISTCFREAGINGEGMKLDVSDSDSVNSVVASVAEKYAPITILVNNAGITRDNLLLRMSPEEWDAVINTNLSSLYRVCKACIRGMMKARAGRIVNISSVVGSSGNAGQTNYSATKAGMLGFTKSLAQEIGSRGITVNAVSPGFIDTDMTKELPEAQRKALLAAIPLGRLGSPEEIAAAVAFLVSEDAAYITGTTLHVNGGMYMT
ncbi:3-oxoacyl-ACP reductase FabG [Thiolapillus sp.]